jgi:hypothetical protein
MKTKSIQYSIPNPCDKSWNDMTPETSGRFCGSCDHSVIDFTSMSDFSIVNYLENHKNEKVCGRFSKPQLDRVYSLNQPVFAPTFDLRAVVLGLGLATFCAIHSFGQTEVPNNPETIDTTITTGDHVPELVVGKVAYRPVDHSNEKVAKGRIKTQYGKFEGISIQLKNKNGRVLQTIKPDSKGNFEFALDWKKNPASIEVSGPDYNTETRYFESMTSLADIQIELEEAGMMIGRVIRVDEGPGEF